MAIAERARESGEIFSRRSLELLQAGSRGERSLPKFDAAAAEAAHDKLDAAVEAFIDAMRPDRRPAPARLQRTRRVLGGCHCGAALAADQRQAR
jgi:hypothetical protein